MRLLGQVERQVSRRVEVVLAEEGLNIELWRVLDLLDDGAGHPMSEIASTVVVPGPTLTKIMDKLVDLALVYRLVDEFDRRRVLAFTSDRGRALRRKLAPKVSATEKAALESLGPEAPQLVTLLGQLAETWATPSSS